MNLENLKEWLIGQGFKVGDEYLRDRGVTWYAWRKSKRKVRACETNRNKNIQIVVYPFAFCSHESVEIEVCGEVDRRWYKLMAYSISPDELVANLDEIEDSLLNAWGALKFVVAPAPSS